MYRIFAAMPALPQLKYAPVHAGNLLDQHWGQEKIEILFIDICKSPKLHDHATRMWFPRLIPGRSIVIQQDYGWMSYYWGNIMMELYKDHFEILDNIPVASRVYLCTRAITEHDAAEKVFSNVSPDDKLRLMDDALRSVGQSQFRDYLLINLALTAQSIARDDIVQQTLMVQLQTFQEQLPAQVAQWRGRVAAMESGKFWKLRQAWFRIKGALGLDID